MTLNKEQAQNLVLKYLGDKFKTKITLKSVRFADHERLILVRCIVPLTNSLTSQSKVVRVTVERNTGRLTVHPITWPGSRRFLTTRKRRLNSR